MSDLDAFDPTSQTSTIRPGSLRLADLRRLAWSEQPLRVNQAFMNTVATGVQVIDEILRRGAPVYGVNTGFGKLAQTRIPDHKIKSLQRNLVLSHAAGTGALLPDTAIRLTLILKINCLAQGYSGVRPEVIDALVELVNTRLYPCVPGQGSVGASGDLAPLAHIAAALIGVGEMRHDGAVLSAMAALNTAGIKPLELEAKEGLALLNGTQVSTALALHALFQFEDAFAAAVVAGALSVDAALGSDTPFSPRANAVRRQFGQIRLAETYRRLLDGSAIRQSHLACDRVQDPYSLRCQPQVMGACFDHMRFVADQLETEANAVTDNPLVFPWTRDVLSCGNFHAEPIAMAADTLALAVAETGALSERRIALLIDSALSQLPPFLAADPGVNSGFMIPQVTAAALVSENKSLAHPASVDSLPTSANQEDHVSMATYAARRLLSMVENLRGIIAVELLAAAQGIQFRRPLTSSEPLEAAVALIRQHVPPHDGDRYFAPDITAIKQLIEAGRFSSFVPEILVTQSSELA